MSLMPQANLKLFPLGGDHRRPKLLFVFRDQGLTPLARLSERWLTDLDAIWASIPKPAGLADARMHDFFEVRLPYPNPNSTPNPNPDPKPTPNPAITLTTPNP